MNIKNLTQFLKNTISTVNVLTNETRDKIKMILKDNEEIILTEYIQESLGYPCITYDGGRHPEYNSNVYSSIKKIYCQNNKILIETEDGIQDLQYCLLLDLITILDTIITVKTHSF
jgi:hypothetical protein